MSRKATAVSQIAAVREKAFNKQAVGFELVSYGEAVFDSQEKQKQLRKVLKNNKLSARDTLEWTKTQAQLSEVIEHSAYRALHSKLKSSVDDVSQSVISIKKDCMKKESVTLSNINTSPNNILHQLNECGLSWKDYIKWRVEQRNILPMHVVCIFCNFLCFDEDYNYHDQHTNQNLLRSTKPLGPAGELTKDNPAPQVVGSSEIVDKALTYFNTLITKRVLYLCPNLDEHIEEIDLISSVSQTLLREIRNGNKPPKLPFLFSFHNKKCRAVGIPQYEYIPPLDPTYVSLKEIKRITNLEDLFINQKKKKKKETII